MIEFHLDQRSGVAPYLQIVQQVKEALRLGLLDVGDQLPTVREVVADLAINPNTVAKGYRELEASHPEMTRRIMFVTGDVAGTEAERFLEDTGTRWLAKPFRLKDLLRAARDMVT